MRYLFGFLILVQGFMGVFMLCGGNPLSIMHLPPIILLLSVTLGGMIFYGIEREYFIFSAKALFSKPIPNKKYCHQSKLCGRIARAAGVISFIVFVILTLSAVDDGPETVGLRVAQTFSGVLYSLFLSEFLFGVLEYRFRDTTADTTETSYTHFAPTIYLFLVFASFSLLFYLLWILTANV